MRNQLCNIFYPYEEPVPSLYPFFSQTENTICADVKATRVTVFGTSCRGGLSRTSWARQWYHDNDGNVVNIHTQDPTFPQERWTKVSIHARMLADVFFTLTFYKDKAQVQGSLRDVDLPHLTSTILACAKNADTPMSLRAPYLALAVFNGNVGFKVYRMDTPTVLAQRTNPYLPACNVQNIQRNVVVVRFLNTVVRLHCNGTFTVSYTKCSGDAISELWTNSAQVATAVTEYVVSHVRNGTLLPKRNCTTNGGGFIAQRYKHLPTLNGKVYSMYTSKQLQQTYMDQFGTRVPSPPNGMVWKRKKKKLFLFLRLVGLLNSDVMEGYVKDK